VSRLRCGRVKLILTLFSLGQFWFVLPQTLPLYSYFLMTALGRASPLAEEKLRWVSVDIRKQPFSKFNSVIVDQFLDKIGVLEDRIINSRRSEPEQEAKVESC
jgi:hypothetical protein